MELKFWPFDLKLAHTWRIADTASGPGKDVYPVVFVELSSEDGRAGLGEAAPSARYQENVQTVQAFLKQVDAARLSFEDAAASMRYLDAVAAGNYAAKTAVNLALLDGWGRHTRQPVYDFLKLGFAEGRHVTSFSIGIDTPEVIRQKVEAAAHYPVLKLKLGSPKDKENLAALRDVAPKKPVRVDANEAWRAKDDHIQFVEQPMPAEADPKAMAWLKERSPLPLFGDESYHHADAAPRCADCFHGVNIKLVKSGGISGAYEALRAARRLGLKTMIGCMIESSVLISAAAHLAELADYLDLDGNLLITNDPYCGVTTEKGTLSFRTAEEPGGLRVTKRAEG
jgi:L-alanine-DL-glutamate epimerase-like enolase superfamily enzyme